MSTCSSIIVVYENVTSKGNHIREKRQHYLHFEKTESSKKEPIRTEFDREINWVRAVNKTLFSDDSSGITLNSSSTISDNSTNNTFTTFITNDSNVMCRTDTTYHPPTDESTNYADSSSDAATRISSVSQSRPGRLILKPKKGHYARRAFNHQFGTLFIV